MRKEAQDSYVESLVLLSEFLYAQNVCNRLVLIKKKQYEGDNVLTKGDVLSLADPPIKKRIFWRRLFNE